VTVRATAGPPPPPPTRDEVQTAVTNLPGAYRDVRHIDTLFRLAEWWLAHPRPHLRSLLRGTPPTLTQPSGPTRTPTTLGWWPGGDRPRAITGSATSSTSCDWTATRHRSPSHDPPPRPLRHPGPRVDVDHGRVMKRPRLLDLFCGAGGAAMGYHRAGFDVVGVDIRPQQSGIMSAHGLPQTDRSNLCRLRQDALGCAAKGRRVRAVSEVCSESLAAHSPGDASVTRGSSSLARRRPYGAQRIPFGGSAARQPIPTDGRQARAGL
jgi:hypothetical protein